MLLLGKTKKKTIGKERFTQSSIKQKENSKLRATKNTTAREKRQNSSKNPNKKQGNVI